MDVPLSIPTEHSRTESHPMTVLILTVLQNTDRKKIRHYRQIYVDNPDPIIFMSVTVNTSGHVYDNFVRLIFLHVSRETGALSGELTENLTSQEVHFLHTVSLTNLKDSVGLILTKVSVIRVTIPFDLSTRSFIPLPRFFHSRRASLFLLLPSSYIAQHSV